MNTRSKFLREGKGKGGDGGGGGFSKGDISVKVTFAPSRAGRLGGKIKHRLRKK